jgi:D-sedoheptulose 7-phosphate isomerase
MTKDKKFLLNYYQEFQSRTAFETNRNLKNILKIKDLILKIKKLNKKILIFGNGGSASIASHFSVDLTKNSKVRSVNLNEPNLITCFSNDYDYSNWVQKSIEFYSDKNDLVILMSVSGKSRNMINACKICKKKKLKVITLTGHDRKNPLRRISDVNLHVESKAYNFVENIFQIWLLSIVDLIIGSSEYKV